MIGSIAFNLLFVMAAVSLVAPLPARRASLSVDLPVMLELSLALVLGSGAAHRRVRNLRAASLAGALGT